MQNSLDFYKAKLENHQIKVKRLFKTLSLYSILRLSVFLLTGLGIYATYSQWQVALGIAIAGIVIFLVLLSKYTDLKHERERYKRLVKINKEEIVIASGEFHDRADGSEFQNPSHFYSLDIDLFGKGSFFQYINRTTIKEGKECLVSQLLSNNIEQIPKRQEAIRELVNMPEWRQNYSAIAQGVEVEHPAKNIIKWLKEHKPFLTKTWFGITTGFSVTSVIVFGLAIAELIPLSLLGYWLLLGLALTARLLKPINLVSQHASKAKETFRQYAQLLNTIEQAQFSSELLQEQKNKIELNGIKASEIFLKLSKHIDALDNRNNLISAIFGNGYFLWDIRQTYYIEQWISTYALKVEDWFEVVTFFDAYNSLGNYGFNHKQFAYPKIVKGNDTVLAQGLGHPLLKLDKRIDSDLDVQREQFFIVTGANMAGKSTFLRTVALHIVMANVGLPVCAKESQYRPIKLITSMRTTDSLTDDSSYFFSELTRLKFVVDTVENDSNYFIILDEILKGTNSTDKAIGSRKFVEKLVKLNATGIIATHDLSLTEIESELEAVKNYFFDAQIIDNELYFDYKLKEGVCQNMNASFLLKKMEII